MNRGVRNILLIISGILVFLVLAAALLPFLVENKVKQQIIHEINQQVTVPVEVKGGMSLSLFKHFPNASFTFSDVRIADKLRPGNYLLRVKEFSFLCNIPGLLKGEMEFSKVLLRDGELQLFTDTKGRNNYDILKEDTASSKEKLTIRLQKAEIQEVNFVFLDQLRAVDVNLKLKEAGLTGDFNEERFELSTTTQLFVHRIMAGGEEFLTGKNVGAEMLLDVNKATNKYDFKKGKLTVDGNEFNIHGYLASVKNGMDVHFRLTNEGEDFRKLFQLLPAAYKANFANAEGSGRYAIVAVVKGIFGAGSSPTLDVTADLKDSELKLGKYNKLLKKVNATAKYQIDHKGKDRLIISNFNCTLNNLPFQFTLRLTNLADPDFDFFANGVMHLSELSTFVPESAAKDFKGAVRFNNFRLTGRKRDFTDIQNSTLRGSGDFTLQEVALNARGIIYDQINGKLSYGIHAIEAKDFTIRFGNSDFRFNGTIENLLAYVYTLSDKKTSAVASLGINGKLQTRLFDLSAMMQGFNNQPPSAAEGEPVSVRDIFNIRGNLDVFIERFLFRKTVFEKVSGNLQAAPALLRVNSLSTQTMSGELRGNGLFSFSADSKLNIQADISAIDFSIAEIFRQCESFGQTTLTEKNLEGTISLSTTLNATWNQHKDFDEKSFTALMELNIRNGRLMNFEPIRAASNFIRVEELKDIRFGDLNHTLKIANSKIDIPEFELKSSALNMMISGFHYFNNDVDYRFKINLHKLLAKRFNRRGRDVQYIESDPYEGINIYLLMTGNLSNPTFKYDKSSSRKKMLGDFRKERESLRSLMKNNSKKVEDSEKKREDKYFDLREKPEFMDFDTTGN